ncbi:fimbrial protein [Salmonella enterica]
MRFSVIAERCNVKNLIVAAGLLSCPQVQAINFNTTDVVLGHPGGSYSRSYSMDNLPFIYETGTTLGIRDPYKFNYLRNYNCGGLDAKVNLSVVGSINGQDIYKLTDDVGLLVWMGDTAFNKANPMTGNNWRNVFNQYCTHSSQGYSVYVKPVILKRSTTRLFSTPLTTIGSIRLRPMRGSVFTGKTEFTVSVNNMNINNGARSCTLQTPSGMAVTLPTISQMSIPRAGDEVFAGMVNIRLQCDPEVTVFASLTDSTNPANRSDLLTLAGASTARGVGLKIYRNEDPAALKFGADSPVKGNENQWRLSVGAETSPSVQLKARYINTGGYITPGTVTGISTITFSYQ